MTRLKIVSGKSVASSVSNGFSLVRSRDKLSAVPSAKKATYFCSFSEIEEPKIASIGGDSRSPYNSSVSCGSVSGGGSKALPSTKEKAGGGRNSPPATLIEARATEEPEEPICPEQPYILAAPDGYYGIRVDTDVPELSWIVFLGTQANSKCLVDNIGRIESINVPKLRSNCQPSRWAYVDGVRIHCIPADANIWCGMPMISSVEEDNFTEQTWEDSTFIPQYGYTYGSFGGGAKLGGCAVTGDVSFFFKNALMLSVRETDWDLFDSISWDFEAHLGSGIRLLDGLNIKRDCPALAVYPSGDASSRLTELLNVERYCVVIVDEVEQSPAVDILAEDYAAKMAEFGFLLHEDPYTGELVEDRMVAAEIEFEIVAEVLATIPEPAIDPENPDPNQLIDKVCDDLWAAWKASPVHYDGLINKDRYHVGWGVARAEGGIWYGCGVIYKKVTDEPDPLSTVQVDLPAPPVVKYTDDPVKYPTVFFRGHGYRAISTAPRELPVISCATRSLFFGELALPGDPAQVRIKSSTAYEIRHQDTGSGLIPVPGSALVGVLETYPETILTTGQLIRSPEEESKVFYIQKDACTDKTISVQVDPHLGDLPPANETVIPKEDYFRIQAGLGEDEEEPDYTYSSDIGGMTTLKLGGIVIDTSDKYYRGQYLHLYQDIMVGSVFFTNSGYTALTYSMPKLLETTRRKWSFDGEMIEELYWWVKLEYWAAVVAPNGNVFARWRLGGAPHDFDLEKGVYLRLTKEVYVSEPTQTFHIQYPGVIEKGSASIRCEVNGHDFILIDNEDGTFSEEPNQIPGNETIMSSTEILYLTGVINLTFGTEKPDVYKNLTSYAGVYKVETYQYFEMFGEVVQYDSRSQWINPTQISMAGEHPITPNLTVTEDGSMAFFSCKSSSVEFTGPTRLTYGDKMQLDGKNSFANVYGSSKLQVIAFDLTNILVSEPRRVSEPLFTNALIGDTVILN